uniref:hypothetical protein n=1 Tax=Salmonella enterica TaxID=28901 RepID=UPI0028E9CA99
IRKATLLQTYPELKSKAAFLKRKKEMMRIVKITNPKSIIYGRCIILLHFVKIVLVIFSIVIFLHLINDEPFVSISKAITVISIILTSLGIASLLSAIICFAVVKTNKTQTHLIRKYLKDNPSFVIQQIPDSNDSVQKYYSLISKIARLSFLLSIWQFLVATIVFFLFAN